MIRPFLAKMRGAGRPPAGPGLRHAAAAGLGGGVALAVVALLSVWAEAPLLIAPFGASCVLLFAVPDSPLAQPRTVIGGHGVAALVGVLFFAAFGAAWWVAPLTAGAAIAAMVALRVVHPPAGANPLVVIAGGHGLGFVASPVLAGAVVLVAVALVVNNLPRDRRYPAYW